MSLFINIGKSIFLLGSLWLIIVLSSSAINQHYHKGDDVICNIGQITSLVYVSILPVALIFLYPFHSYIKSNIWMFFNLFLLLFYINLFGVFIYSASEKTNNSSSLSFIYTAKRLSINNVLISCLLVSCFILLGAFYFTFFSNMGIFLSQNIVIRASLILFLLSVFLFLIFIGSSLRKSFNEPDANAFLTSLYGYGKPACAFITSCMLIDFISKNFELNLITGDILYFVLIDLIILGFFIYTIYETKMVCFDTGYKYSVDENKKIELFPVKVSKNILAEKEESITLNEEVIETTNNTITTKLKESFASDLNSDPVISFLKKKLSNIKISINTDISKDPFVIFFKSLSKKISSKKENKIVKNISKSIGPNIKSILDFLTFDSIFKTKTTELSLNKSILLTILTSLSIGAVFAFSPLNFLGFTIRTNTWYIDIATGSLFAIVFTCMCSLIIFICSKVFNSNLSHKDIISLIPVSLLPFSVVSFLSLFFIKKGYSSIILEYSSYVLLAWACGYAFLYIFVKSKIKPSKLLVFLGSSIFFAYIIFLILSSISFTFQKAFNPYYKIPIVRAKNSWERNLSDNIRPIAEYSVSSIRENIELAELRVCDVLEHTKFMKRYKNNTDTSNDEYLYSLRIANEMSDNHNWSTYLYKNQPKEIKKSKEKAKSILNFITSEIKEEKTNYPFGDSFWQDSVTTFKRKAGKIPDIAVLTVALFRTNGIPARICEVTPDQFFNDSYTLVEYYDDSNDNWTEIYPTSKHIKSNQRDLKKLSEWRFSKENIKNLAFYYIHDGIIYPMCSNERNEAASDNIDLLPGEYMASYTDEKSIYTYFFDIKIGQ